MEIKIKDNRLKKVLLEKKLVIKELRKLGKEANELQGKLDKLAMKRGNLIAKTHNILDKKDLELNEFEELNTVEIKGDDIILTTINAIEEYKKVYLEEKNKKIKK